ncbi:MAG TPA: hypothetical protein VG797_09530 [Phycisphaerales bacterium]|nr:hypothetical protein [Phycisphaerales bacterium]
MIARRILFHTIGAVIGGLVALLVLQAMHVTGPQARIGITAAGVVLGLALGRAGARSVGR